MDAYFVDGWEVLVVRDKEGELHALDGMCPHEDFPLVYGHLNGTVLTCANHQWQFDITTGRGVNPSSCRLARYRVEVDGDDVYVDRSETPAPPS
jgi:toluene monooxygenase system ferredoxin subunit